MEGTGSVKTPTLIYKTTWDQGPEYCNPLLLIKRYNLFKVRACSTTFFHLSLFCATFFHLCTFMLFISSKTSSSQHFLL